jgi:hypothetical protein
MPSNLSQALGHGSGPGFACTPNGAPLNTSFFLEPALYRVVVSMVDTNNPGTASLTDPSGNTTTWTLHGNYVYAATPGSNLAGGMYTLALSNGVDHFSIRRNNDGDYKAAP